MLHKWHIEMNMHDLCAVIKNFQYRRLTALVMVPVVSETECVCAFWGAETLIGLLKFAPNSVRGSGFVRVRAAALESFQVKNA